MGNVIESIHNSNGKTVFDGVKDSDMQISILKLVESLTGSHEHYTYSEEKQLS